MDERLLNAEVIVFDVGNVLLSFEPCKISAMLPEACRVQLHEAMFGPEGQWGAFDLALETNEVIARRIAKTAGNEAWWKNIDGIMNQFYITMKPLPLTREISGLKAMGKKLYALTNYGEPAFTSALEHFPFFSYLDGMVVSAREKLVKPDPRIFRLLIRRYGLDPEKTLFIDDTEQNVDAAAREGLKTWLYQLPPGAE